MPKTRARVHLTMARVMPPVESQPVITDDMLAEAEELGFYRPGQRLTHDPVVYYMRMDRLVKIGFTTDIRTRVTSIMPQGVMAVEFGDRDLERERHRMFAGTHSHGREWFWLNESLGAHIAEVRDAFAAAEGLTCEEWLAKQHVRLT